MFCNSAINHRSKSADSIYLEELTATLNNVELIFNKRHLVFWIVFHHFRQEAKFFTKQRRISTSKPSSCKGQLISDDFFLRYSQKTNEISYNNWLKQIIKHLMMLNNY